MLHRLLGWSCSYCAAQLVTRTSKREQNNAKHHDCGDETQCIIVREREKRGFATLCPFIIRVQYRHAETNMWPLLLLLLLLSGRARAWPNLRPSCHPHPQSAGKKLYILSSFLRRQQRRYRSRLFGMFFFSFFFIIIIFFPHFSQEGRNNQANTWTLVGWWGQIWPQSSWGGHFGLGIYVHIYVSIYI